ncbi:MAG TPA: hypothetical protein VGC32_13385 [Solirubrobacterales bacterium]
MTLDARGFVTDVYRLAPPTERPGERIGSQLDAAYLAAVGEVVRAYGEVEAVTLAGVEITGVPHAENGAEVASVETISDPGSVREELAIDGEAVVTITVTLGAEADRVGLIRLSLRLSR